MWQDTVAGGVLAVVCGLLIWVALNDLAVDETDDHDVDMSGEGISHPAPDPAPALPPVQVGPELSAGPRPTPDSDGSLSGSGVGRTHDVRPSVYGLPEVQADEPEPEPDLEEPPPVLEHDAGWSATCVASYYGEAHRGLTTASGVPFDPDASTAATWDHPFGTVLQVRHDGRTVEVEITDRGPARRLNRCIDLSQAAFAELAPLGAGLIDVQIKEK